MCVQIVSTIFPFVGWLLARFAHWNALYSIEKAYSHRHVPVRAHTNQLAVWLYACQHTTSVIFSHLIDTWWAHASGGFSLVCVYTYVYMVQRVTAKRSWERKNSRKTPLLPFALTEWMSFLASSMCPAWWSRQLAVPVRWLSAGTAGIEEKLSTNSICSGCKALRMRETQIIDWICRFMFVCCCWMKNPRINELIASDMNANVYITRVFVHHSNIQIECHSANTTTKRPKGLYD